MAGAAKALRESVKELQRRARVGTPELGDDVTRRVARSTEGARARGVENSIPNRIKEVKKLEESDSPLDQEIAKYMRNAIAKDAKRMGVELPDYNKGGMPKKKKGYMSGGMANGKKHSYVAGGYVTDMMGKNKK
jgi:hypothetical protein